MNGRETTPIEASLCSPIRQNKDSRIKSSSHHSFHLSDNTPAPIHRPNRIRANLSKSRSRPSFWSWEFGDGRNAINSSFSALSCFSDRQDSMRNEEAIASSKASLSWDREGWLQPLHFAWSLFASSPSDADSVVGSEGGSYEGGFSLRQWEVVTKLAHIDGYQLSKKRFRGR